jgi:hypothetical protein
MKRKSQRHRNRIRRPHQQRRGSSLLIVMVLMGMLSLLGVIFYLFAAQERSNAEYYSEASKELEDPGLDADVLFDWALEQIIVGTDARLKNSMLWGSRYSLVSNLVGFSTHRPDPTMQPFNGEGVNVIFDVNTGVLGVDQNRNGLIDDPANAGEPDNRFLLNFVDSPAAQNLNERPLTNGSFPQPDAGFTYPDINSPFLCYVSKVRDQNGNLHRVVKPSYMVPGVLRPTSTSTTNLSWYSDTNVKARVMRAHPGHQYVPPTQSPASPAPRYIATPAEATSLLGAGGQVFPQSPMDSTYDTTGGGAGAVVTSGRMGIYTYVDTTGALETVEFDYDNDGDGINESILIDLDFPPQQDASGKMFVPLFLVTIHDLDALMNMNAHGNLSKVLYGPADIASGLATTPISSGGTGAWFGTDTSNGNFYFLSQSNLGLSPSEVNPLWALNRRVGIDDTFTFTQHSAVFGSAPTLVSSGTSPMWGETANMEFFWSKVGRYQTAPTRDLFVGVYGEPSVLYNASTGGSFATAGGQVLPRPGYSLSDDNGDLTEGQGYYPYFQHPLDYTGQGSYIFGSTGPLTKKISFATPAGTADPANRWIKYSKYNNANPATIKWGLGAGLMTGTLTQGLGDDASEVAYYATDNRDADSLLTSDEMLYLQLNNSEIDRLNVTSRLANLLPFNFDKTKGTNSRAESIRRKFTTQSNDRKSFSLPYAPTRFANEYNVDSNTGTSKFPPQFGSVVRYATTALAEDPFRPAVRSLLEIEVNGQQNITRPQRKLSLNGILTGGTTTPMSFRPLTPHPDDPGAAPITATYSPTNLPVYPPASSDYVAQEYWARRDRQQLCRDIYVLLYLLGVSDAATISPTATGAYTPAQCAQMAQFAVNLVDAMDKDVVMTRFEYDLDLSNGWSLDDDPYTSSTTTPPSSETAAERGEVFGVERLDMSISEAMIVRTEAMTPSGDHPATFYPDGTQHHFAYVELYNQSPFDLTFDDKAAWQVVMKQTGKFERRLSFKSGAMVVPAGSRYTIGSAEADLGGMPPGKSIFKLDPNWVSGTPDFTTMATWMAPYLQPINNGSTKGLDLLDVTTPTSTFIVEDNANPPNDLTTTTGAWVTQLSTADPTKPVNFLLRRRLHPTRTRTSPLTVASENDNPWVTVDQMNLPKFGTFTLATSTDDKTKIQTALNAVSGSFERFEPFGGTAANVTFPTNESQHPPSGVGSNNTLSALNSTAVNPFTVWQPHFDRDFASIIDLFFLPLTGPDTLTANLVDTFKTAPENQTTPYSASAMILNPASATFPNRWHRLLEMIEVPTRTNRNLGIAPELSIPRVPGRINLNTLRHPENWAGLLDDARYFYLDMTVGTVPAGSDNPPYMPDTLGDRTDWWRSFLISRDGIDPYASNTASLSIPVPGLPGLASTTTPGSKPFRSLSDVSFTALGGTKTPSVEDTILRNLPDDVSLAQKRRLVEIGNNGEHATFTAIDPLIRNRLLAKMANNSTTRSNNFAIFVSVKYFAAASDPAYGGAIRIGGPLNGKPEPEHRGFFVVDRSKLEQGKYTGSANYDFRAFIDYRKTLATQ